jgi:hypothetical protein
MVWSDETERYTCFLSETVRSTEVMRAAGGVMELRAAVEH